MLAKIINDEVIKYPYTELDLRKDYPNVSFAYPFDDSSLLAFNLKRVYPIPPPLIEWNQRVNEGVPILRGDTWVQSWIVEYISAEEAAVLGKQLRSEAYKNEADPLFFKAQRGEATMQQWLDKVEEIKQRYSY